MSHTWFAASVDNNTQLKKLRKKCRVFLTGDFVAELKEKLNGVGLSDCKLYPVVEEGGKPVDSDAELYAKIVEHRRKFYHVGYADYDKDYRDRIEFYPPEHRRKAWENDYNDLLVSFVYGDKKPFAELLTSIEGLQSLFRSNTIALD